MTLILASQSPRRRELLTQLGYQFSCENADIDETVIANESPRAYVERLARDKAETIAKRINPEGNTAILGSDTSVVIDGVILGKPENKEDCLAQLSLLSGKQHQVLTAVAVVMNNKIRSIIVETNVTFKVLTQADILAYWQTGEPCDKAGSYGIQGIGGQFVTHISGSYFAVVGLPLYETAELLSAVGIKGNLAIESAKG